MNLDPVGDALLAQARRDAERIRAAAGAEADARVTRARQEADRLLQDARAEGEAEAAAVAATELARARRQAREIVLSAQHEAYRRAHTEARRAASELRHTAGYPALITALAGVARQQLGAGAAVVVDDQAGGLVATEGSRSVDYRLPVIASRCVVALGGEVEDLWR